MNSIDHLVNLQTAMDKIGDKALVCGNFDPVSVLLEESVETVKENVRRCLDIGKDRIMISAGCEVPKFTPLENLRAVAEALEK